MKYFNCINVFSLRAGDVSVLFKRGHNHLQNMLQLVNNEQFLLVHLPLTKGCLLSIMLFIQKISSFPRLILQLASVDQICKTYAIFGK